MRRVMATRVVVPTSQLRSTVPASHRRSQPKRRGRPCALGSSRDDSIDPQQPPSSEEVQDRLVGMLQLEIGKKQVEGFVEEKGETLKAKAEQAKEELDKLGDLTKARADLAFNSALADINKEADDFEEQLRQSREELQAREAELEQWEQDVAVARSEGQFFKSLYQTDKKRPVGQGSQELQQRADRVVQPARSELGSRLRFWLFGGLAGTLGLAVLADLQSDAPSPGQDALYAALAVALAFTAARERRELP